MRKLTYHRKSCILPSACSPGTSQEVALTTDLKFIDALRVFKWLAIDDTGIPAPQAIFVFGNSSIGPVRKAAQLWHAYEGLGVYFTSIGGRFGGNITFGRNEIEQYRLELLSEGVPEPAIHFPVDATKHTTNTLVEARGAMPFIESVLGRRPEVVILCSRSVHQRRAWATFCKQNPTVGCFNASDGERLTGELLPRLVDECDRLDEYGAKGDLVVQNIPDEVARIVEELRTHLQMPIPVAIMEMIHTRRRRLGMPLHHLGTT